MAYLTFFCRNLEETRIKFPFDSESGEKAKEERGGVRLFSSSKEVLRLEEEVSQR